MPRLVWSHNNRTELGTLLNITFWPKTELQTCQTSQKTKQFTNIKLYVPRIVWSHNNLTELWTLLKITFWPKTELQTCQTSQKTEQFTNIELLVPRLLHTHSNLGSSTKTELWTHWNPSKMTKHWTWLAKNGLSLGQNLDKLNYEPTWTLQKSRTLNPWTGLDPTPIYRHRNVCYPKVNRSGKILFSFGTMILRKN